MIPLITINLTILTNRTGAMELLFFIRYKGFLNSHYRNHNIRFNNNKKAAGSPCSLSPYGGFNSVYQRPYLLPE
jgi:hypothetical protein